MILPSIVLVSGLLASDPPAPAPINVELNDLRCGQQCVKLLLGAFGIPASDEALGNLMPLSEHGVSLAQVQSALRHYGLGAEVIECAPDSLERLPLPCIVHTGLTDARGHYLVLVEAKDDVLRLIDGTAALPGVWRKADFARQFSGYVVHVVPANLAVLRRASQAAMILGCCAALALTWLAWREYATRFKSGRARS